MVHSHRIPSPLNTFLWRHHASQHFQLSEELMGPLVFHRRRHWITNLPSPPHDLDLTTEAEKVYGEAIQNAIYSRV